jgi:hypothetical protein
VAKTIAMFIADFLKRFDVDSQNVIMEKVMGHELLDIVMPPYLHDVKKLKHNQQLIENFIFGLSNHVAGHRSSKLVLAQDIVCNFAASQSIGNN